MTPFASRLPKALVPLADQVVVSAGTFLFNMVLVRNVPLSDFGHFALVSGGLLLIQTVCGSLIHFPLSIQAATLDDEHQKRIIGAALVSAFGLGSALAVPLTAALGLFLAANLLPAALAALLAGVLQEAARRGLLATFRYAAAVPGDALSYAGQAALLLVVARVRHVDLAAALWVMAATSLAAAALQIWQIGLRGSRPMNPLGLASEFWNLGRWPLSSNLLGIARTSCIPWLLTSMAGPVAAGAFQIALNLVAVANPVVIGICSVVPQMAARAARFGRRAAWKACSPVAAAGLALVATFVAVLLAEPCESATLVYGPKPEIAALDASIRLLAIGALLNYPASVLFAYLCGVRAGGLAITADVAATLLMAALLPVLTSAFGLSGAAAALAMAVALRLAILGAETARSVRRGSPQDDALLPTEGRERVA